MGQAYRADVIDGDRALGDVGGVVSHAFEIARDLERGGDHPEVDRDRLAQGQNAHHQLVDLPLERVDSLVVRDDARGEAFVEPDQRADRRGKLLLDDSAHFENRIVHTVQFLVVGLDRVLGSHGSVSFRGPCGAGAQPKRPVM